MPSRSNFGCTIYTIKHRELILILTQKDASQRKRSPYPFVYTRRLNHQLISISAAHVVSLSEDKVRFGYVICLYKM